MPSKRSALTKPTARTNNISPERLREHAENIAHSNRGIYPVGPLLDAADTIQRLRTALTEIATGRDEEGFAADFPRERAQEALDGE